MNVIKRDGSVEPLSVKKIHKITAWACEGLNVSQSELEAEVDLLFFDGIKTTDIHEAIIKSASILISVKNPDYTFVASRLLLQKLYKEANNSTKYEHLANYITKGIAAGRLNPQLGNIFDLEKLDRAIVQKRDLYFAYLGLQTLADRYLVRDTEDKIIELPQHFWMRVAMGLALDEKNPTGRAIEFYTILSKLEFVSSTPTLFNSGTPHSQMSSCYLNTVEDSIEGIYGTITECAQFSKFAGGVGTDWSRVRGADERIKGTNGKSAGVVPYLKVFNDTAVAVNQGGRRQGSFAAFIEPWHPDLMAFIDLKKNSGDERRRAHEIFPALWCPDLFFKRVEQDGVWSLFSPHEYPELHELHGEAFEARYEELERMGVYKEQLSAVKVWRKILSSLFETGHPWIDFKDECNRRNPQAHVGVIHSSNLCQEITLVTSDTESAVCNLGSINLARVAVEELPRVVKTAIRMLDNVIDLNFYPSERAKLSNLNHRPIGLGVMGYTEMLVKNGIDWESDEHLELADKLFEAISYHAIDASSDLAAERGCYQSYSGSTWSRGILPIDTAKGVSVYERKRQDLEEEGAFNWFELRKKIASHGMRNSNLMAIAPTATISNIAGTTPCIEPIFERQYLKANLSGGFIVVDPCLRYGKPELCKEVFEIDQAWIIKAAAVRQKWIDQSQSINIFAKRGIRGSDLEKIYFTAWKLGLKTTYYLRSQSAEVQPRTIEKQSEPEAKACSIDNPDCESCQ
ncbi:ribonucleoside-diphosphate reductase subunit alpha [Ferrovum sp.]|uniref:ribonucleoside-diphosphate reductase subunit alpha n=1 Tax=Ferrovum sp. TaxID=2609467 RepID=UPI0026241B94|nr:ribonucleoside-diphosphate reductase subunit alpha [Ferrovum sp.]